jgi:hypothetical protein
MGVGTKTAPQPYKPDWRNGLKFAQAAPRCQAHRRRLGTACKAPAIRGRRACRLHGGKGGAPTGERNGAYKTGRYTAEAKAERRELWAMLRALREVMAAL